MDREVENALNELIERLDEKKFFEKYCRLVCPLYGHGMCEKCPLTKMEIMELWACNTDVFDSVERQVYDNKKE